MQLKWETADAEACQIQNNAVGGDRPGAPDATTVLPRKMPVDHVRVSQ